MPFAGYLFVLLITVGLMPVLMVAEYSGRTRKGHAIAFGTFAAWGGALIWCASQLPG